MHSMSSDWLLGSVKLRLFLILMCQDDKGIIPRLCEGLYSEMDQRKSSDAVSFCTEVR